MLSPESQLNYATIELLEMLAEESAELVQAKSKLCRHGPGSHHPLDVDRLSNYAHLVREYWDVLAVARQLGLPQPTEENLREIWQRKLRYTHHQRD